MMVRRLLLALALIALQGCVNSGSPFGADAKSQYDSAQDEVNFIKSYPALSVRNGNQLTLRFRNMYVFTFDNVDSNSEQCFSDQCESAHVVGYWPAKDAFLLDTSFFEGWGAVIVSNDGNVTTLGNRPVFSRNVTHFFTFNDGLSAVMSAIEVWNYSGLHPVRVYEDSGNEVCDIVWETDSRLRIKTGFYDVDKGCDQKGERSIIMDADGIWHSGRSTSREFIRERK